MERNGGEAEEYEVEWVLSVKCYFFFPNTYAGVLTYFRKVAALEDVGYVDLLHELETLLPNNYCEQ